MFKILEKNIYLFKIFCRILHSIFKHFSRWTFLYRYLRKIYKSIYSLKTVKNQNILKIIKMKMSIFYGYIINQYKYVILTIIVQNINTNRNYYFYIKYKNEVLFITIYELYL